MPTDLASEIFGRLRELHQEQEIKDYEKQKNLISLYADMGKQVDPNSIGTYLEGFEKLMFPSNVTPKGFDKKGFMNFVRSFSGMPSDDFGTRLGSEFRELTSKFVGPREARVIGDRANLAKLFQPQTPEQQATSRQYGQGPESLKKKIVFRDPQEEALEKIKTQYGLQYQTKMNELATRENYMRERQRLNDERDFANRWELAQHNSTIKARQGIETEAMKVAQLDGRRYPRDEDYDRAIQNISRRDNLNENVVRQRAGYLEARTKEAQKTIERGGLKPTDIDRRLKNYQTAQENLIRSEGALKGITEEQSRLINQINTTVNTYPGYKFRFDPSKGDLIVEQTPAKVREGQVEAIKGMAADDASKLLNDYRELERRKKEEEGKAEGHRKSVEEYKPYTQPAKPQRPQAGPRVGLGTARPPGSVMITSATNPDLVREAKTKKPGTSIRNTKDGKTYRLFSVGEDNVILIPVP